MAAVDTFEWFTAMLLREGKPELVRFIAEQRDYLYALRSEDERQRFVEDLMNVFRKRAASRQK